MKHRYMESSFYDRAKKIERSFKKSIRTGQHSFKTGLGRTITILGISTSDIIFRVDSTESIHKLNRLKFKQALAFVLFNRNVSRKDLEQFHSFNSHLMAVLNAALSKNMSRILRLANRTLRLVIKGVRYYFSGMELSAKDRLLVQSQGGKFILMSNYYLRGLSRDKLLATLRHCRDIGLHVIIDSGSFSVMRQANKSNPDKKINDICLKQYCELLISIKEYIMGYFNLDEDSNIEKSKRNLKYLSANVGFPPYPVWHQGFGWDELDKLVNSCEHQLIGIGGTVFMHSTPAKRKLFQEIFSKYGDQQGFHWLGGSSVLLNEFPFISTDSTGFNIGRRFRRLVPLNSPQIAAPSEMDSIDCIKYNIRQLVKLENNHHDHQYELPL